MCAVNGQQQQSQKMEGRQAVLLEAKAMSQRGKSELVRAGKQQPSGGMRRLKAIKIPVESISIVYTHTQADVELRIANADEQFGKRRLDDGALKFGHVDDKRIKARTQRARARPSRSSRRNSPSRRRAEA